MLLSEAIQRVRFLIDDRDENPLVTDSDITIALQTALDELWQLTVDSGANLYTLTATLTPNATGEIDRTSINPIKVVALAWQSGQVFIDIPAARPYEGTVAAVGGGMTVRIIYVPRAVFPASGASPFIWSTAAIADAVLDQLLCAIAASQVWVRTGEPPLPSLTRRIDELKKSVASKINIPNVTVARPHRRVTGMGGSPSGGMRWQRYQHNKIQLVY